MKHNIILIGCGGMAKQHAARFEPLYDRLEVAACVDIDIERAKAVSDCLPNKPPVFTDYREALPLGDAVLQVLPHHLHSSITIDCLNAGKHVLAEKPLANTEEECLAMIEAARKNDRILMVAYCMRYHPLLREMKRLIETEEYGKCFQLSIWTEQLTKIDQPWKADRRYLGGGQLFSHGCHYIDLMLWMLGEPVSGAHMGSNLCTEWMDREGTSNVCMKFKNGAMGYHFGTWGARGTRMAYSFQAHCEKGLIEFKSGENKLFWHGESQNHVPGKEAGEEVKLLLDGGENVKPTASEMEHFLDCIENGSRPETTPEESLTGLKVIWELYDAEEQNRLADFSSIFA